MAVLTSNPAHSFLCRLRCGHRSMQVRRAIPEIDDCNLHILRHTFVCRRLDGVAMYTLSKLLGHSSIRVTEAHYANRVRAGRAEQAIKALEALRGTART